jgi:predicted nucleic acid-binding protein
MAKPKRVYWDSCAWLGLVNGEADKKRELGIIYTGARRGQYEIWTSAVSIAEVCRHADEMQQPKPLDPAKLKVLDDLFLQPFVKVVPYDLETARAARKLYRETAGLGKKWDAAHLATAMRSNIETMHTYDRDDLLHLSGKLICRNSNPLIICYPDETTDGALFAKRGKA